MSLPEPPPQDPRRRSPGLVGVLAGAVIVLLVVAVAATAAASRQQREIAELRESVAALEEALREERAAADAESAEEDRDRPGLFDGPGDLSGLFEGLLDGLLGDDGFGDLFGDLGLGDDLLLSCLQPGGRLEPAPSGPVQDQVDAIAERVERLRELTFPQPFETRFLTPDEFEADLRERVEAAIDPDEVEVERRRLVSLGAIPDDVDLVELQLDLISGQAAGFYDPDETVIVVAVDDPGAPLSPVEQVVLAHELEHALSDAVHGLPSRETDRDAALAALSLVEGSASVLMQRYALAVLGMGDQLMLGLDPGVRDAQARIDAFPHHLRRELLFPYEDGLVFTCHLLADGGWAAVDDAFTAPPDSSAQILWPDRYRDDEAAVEPMAPPGLPAAWGEPATDTFGAAELLWLLEAPGGDLDAALDRPLERAAAWAAGQAHTWVREGDTAVALRLVDGRGGLCATVAQWYDAAFPDAQPAPAPESAGQGRAWTASTQEAVLSCPGDHVLLGIGPDAETARDLAG